MRQLLILATIVFLGGVPAAHAQSMKVFPIEQVVRDRMPVVEDFSGSEAVLKFVSSIPLACSVIYGKTAEFGRIAVDADMDGGAHSEHRPILTNLEPDTVYHFRVQGTAADGRLFASRNMTFRTPPRDTSAAVNLLSLDAGARIVGVSSNYGGASNAGSWGADSAIDGKRSTEWATNGDGDNAFIEIALGGKSKLDAIEVWTRTMSDGTAQISTFTVTTDTGKTFGPFTLNDASKPFRFDIDATASWLRLDVKSSSGGNTGLVEFAAYGKKL